MLKRMVSGIMLTLLLVSMLTLVINVRQVEGQSTLGIDDVTDDGSYTSYKDTTTDSITIEPKQSECPGDANGDGIVDWQDHAYRS